MLPGFSRVFVIIRRKETKGEAIPERVLLVRGALVCSSSVNPPLVSLERLTYFFHRETETRKTRSLDRVCTHSFSTFLAQEHTGRYRARHCPDAFSRCTRQRRLKRGLIASIVSKAKRINRIRDRTIASNLSWNCFFFFPSPTMYRVRRPTVPFASSATGNHYRVLFSRDKRKLNSFTEDRESEHEVNSRTNKTRR